MKLLKNMVIGGAFWWLFGEEIASTYAGFIRLLHDFVLGQFISYDVIWWILLAVAGYMILRVAHYIEDEREYKRFLREEGHDDNYPAGY